MYVSPFCDIQRDNLTTYFNELGIQSFKYGQTFIFLRSVYNVHELHELFLYLPCVCSNRPTSLCFKNVPYFYSDRVYFKSKLCKEQVDIPIYSKAFLYISCFKVSIIIYFTFTCFQIYIFVKDVLSIRIPHHFVSFANLAYFFFLLKY